MTTTLKIGTGVCLVIEHDPIVLAKTVATLDVWSGGRLIFGIGGGWNDHLKCYQEMDVERVVIVSPRRLDDALPCLIG